MPRDKGMQNALTRYRKELNEQVKAGKPGMFIEHTIHDLVSLIINSLCKENSRSFNKTASYLLEYFTIFRHKLNLRCYMSLTRLYDRMKQLGCMPTAAGAIKTFLCIQGFDPAPVWNHLVEGCYTSSGGKELTVAERVEMRCLEILEKPRAESDALLYRENPNDDDCVILSGVEKSRFKCPYSLQRIQMPVRTVKCQHVECFDLLAFVTLVTPKQGMAYPGRPGELYYPESRKRKKCPLCRQNYFEWEDLHVDWKLKDEIDALPPEEEEPEDSATESESDKDSDVEIVK